MFGQMWCSGSLCFKLFLKNQANTIASLQYLLRGICVHHKSHNLPLILGLNYACIFPRSRYVIFILFVGLSGHNSEVFLNFSDGAAFNLSQQLLFVFIAWILDYINYTLTNVLCTRAYDISPIYVGTACLKQYQRTRRALSFIAAHIISDVYLGMVFAMEGGIYFADEGLLLGANSTGVA